MTKVFAFNPDMVAEVVEGQLGQGKKVSQCTDKDLAKLENIYNAMLTYSIQFNL
jgi:hypothetical protein